MKIIQVVGARPNFMKVYPLHKALDSIPDVQSMIVHTGQHSDASMSDVFFEQLQLPKPDHFLGIFGGTHVKMMAEMMLAFENVILAEKPDLVVVVGDVNSTLACALTSAKLNIPIAHVEAGLRSFDRSMPEEINRIVTDQLSDYLFTTESSANINLISESISKDKIHFVGNCMIDSLMQCLPETDSGSIRRQLKIEDTEYAIMTMHRPSNVDTKSGLEKIIGLCNVVSKNIKVIFPVHPRTRNKIESFGLWEILISNENLILTDPLRYFEFLSLMKESSVVLTDSGGLQEETTYLKIPCLTFRKTTERPVTIDVGSNVLIDNFNMDQTMDYMNQILSGKWKHSGIPELWDGKAAERIANCIIRKG